MLAWTVLGCAARRLGRFGGAIRSVVCPYSVINNVDARIFRPMNTGQDLVLQDLFFRGLTSRHFCSVKETDRSAVCWHYEGGVVSCVNNRTRLFVRAAMLRRNS